MLRQMVIVTLLTFRTLKVRFWQSMVIVVGMACVVGVLLSMLSLVEGQRRAYGESGDPRDVIVVAKGNQWETSGTIPVTQGRIMLDTPGIAKAADGKPMADISFLTGVPGLSVKDGSRAYMPIRAINANRADLRGVRLTAGRMFRPGSREFIAGERMPLRVKNAGLGDKVIMPDGEWEIVGVFAANVQLDSSLLGDIATVMGTMRRNAYHSIEARLETQAAYEGFRHALTGNPMLSVDVYRMAEWNVRSIAGVQKFFQIVIYGIATLLAIGALFGCINTMYAAVESRKQEIATLRAIGYGGAAVAVSVLLEAVLLTGLGALIGAAIAWGFYDGTRSSMGGDGLVLVVSPGMVGLGLLWAAGVAFLGGIFPAIRAARWAVADALRAK